MNISHGDILEALEQALAPQGPQHDGLTVEEITQLTGRSRKIITRGLHNLQAAGRLEVGRRYVPRLDGILQLRPTYRIVEPT